MTKTRAAIHRALRTCAQTAVAVIGTTTIIEGVDWELVASSAALAGVVSILTSVSTDLPEVG